MNNIPDLWPADLADDESESPISILKGQAGSLGKRTGGIVEARITKFRYADDDENDPDDLMYNFNIIGPSIGNYRVTLFELHAKMHSLYPVTIKVPSPDGNAPTLFEIKNQSELLETLKKILTDNRTVNIIRAIRAHSIGLGAKPKPDEVPF